ncbi:MAG: tetratricopeptide repeat protein [Proteobacteria bacterium]|nr:tetratricopeptide repeat protein [Pseudomonadota bacterium]
MASTTGRSLRTSASLVRALAIALSFGFLMGVATAAAAAASAATPQNSGASSSAPDNLSIMLMAREGQLERAAEQLRAEFDDDRANLALANRLAITYAALGRIEDSREVLETALASNAASAKTFENLKVLAGIQFARSYAQALGQPAPPNPQGLDALDGDGLQVGALKQQLAAYEQAKIKAEADRLAAERLAAQQLAAERLAAERPSTEGAARAKEEETARAIETMLMQWAKAWSSVDFERYAGFYDVSFSNDRFKTRADWLAFRKPRIVGKSSIRVELSEVEVRLRKSSQGPTRANARFSQRYESGRLRLNVRKEMDLVYRGNQWFIQSEGN